MAASDVLVLLQEIAAIVFSQRIVAIFCGSLLVEQTLISHFLGFVFLLYHWEIDQRSDAERFGAVALPRLPLIDATRAECSSAFLLL